MLHNRVALCYVRNKEVTITSVQFRLDWVKRWFILSVFIDTVRFIGIQSYTNTATLPYKIFSFPFIYKALGKESEGEGVHGDLFKKIIHLI